MKKLLILALIILMLGSCSTYYGKYDYNRYFQNNEPYVVVDSEEEAAAFIARKLARRFKRVRNHTISVLPFTDEYGDRINRGDFFAGTVVAYLGRYRNPIVVERESLYELVKEREVTMTNRIDNEGYELRQLLQADYILHGRILRWKHEDMISVRCFEVGTGQVVYAATVSIDYTPEPEVIYVPTPTPPIPHPTPPSPRPTPQPPTPPNPKPTPDPEPDDKKEPTGGVHGTGKIDLDDQKKDNDDQKKKPPTPPVVNKPTYDKPVVKKEAPVVKKAPVKNEPEPVNKDPQVEEKKEKSEEKKESSGTKTVSKKKTSTVKK